MTIFRSISDFFFSHHYRWTTARERRRAKILLLANMFILSASLLYWIVPTSILIGQMALIYGAFAYSLAGIILLRFGWLRVSSVFSVFMLWLIFAIGTYTEGGLHSGLYAVNIMIIIFAGLVLGLRGAVSLAVISIVGGCVAAYMKLNGMLPPPAIVNSEINLLGDFIIYIGFTAVFTGIAVDHMDGSSAQMEYEIAEKNSAADALRQSEETHRHLLENMNEGVMQVDNDDVVLFVNRRFTQILGYAPDEIVGRVAYEYLLDPVHHETIRKINRDRTRHIESQYEMEFTSKDGRSIPFLVNGAPLCASDGRVIGSIGTLTDISDRKNIELEMKAAKEHFETLFMTNPEPTIIVRIEDGSITNINDAFTVFTNYGADEVIGKKTFDVKLFQHSADYEGFVKEIFRHGHCNGYESALLMKGGRTSIGSLSARIITLNNVEQMIIVIHDISARKRTEEALVKSERLLGASQEVARIGYLVSDLSTGRWESSQILNEILGIDECFVFDLRHGLSLVAPAFRRIVHGHINTTLRMRTRLEFDCQIIRLQNRDVRWVSVVGEPEYDAKHAPVRMICTIQDITDRKLLEQQLIQAQKLEGVGTLAGGIAHDFNNLLAMILGSAEMMRHHINGCDSAAKYVDRIIDASERGTSISRQLLIFSRPDQAEQKPISIGQTIDELQNMLKHFLPKTIAIEAAREPGTRTIIGDAGQLQQALINLALNAADAMKQTGRLKISEFYASSDDLRGKFPLIQSGRYVGICVADTGMGMDEALLGKIFDPFFSTKEKGKGTGLGLAIVHGIVKSHRGFIDVRSVPGKGTNITLYFPATDKKERVEKKGNAPESGKQVGTILLVEDETVFLDVMRESLAEAGYRILTATNGSIALEIFTAHHPSIDLVITDLGMPDVGGEELIGRLRAVVPRVIIIVASGYVEPTTRERLRESGIRTFLNKPFKMEEIHAAVQNELEEDRKRTDR